MLDELDQKGDYLVAKYIKDPGSLSAEDGQKLLISLTRYYEQKEGLDGDNAARQAVNDLLSGNLGYKSKNYNYPYLSYNDHKEQYNDAYWDSVEGNSHWIVKWLANPLTSRGQDKNEQYYREQYNIQKYLQSTEWERQVGRPVMNFLPGGVGFIYNATDTAMGSYHLGEGLREIYQGGGIISNAGLKVLDGVITLAPVVASSRIPKGNSTGSVGGIITGVDSSLPGHSSYNLLPNTNNLINSPDLGSSLSHQLDKNTVTVYRIEGDANARLLIDGQGNVAITGNTALYLNFGDPIRAREFLSKRIIQNMEGATIKKFEVPQSVLEDLRKNAIHESKIKEIDPNKTKPIIADPTRASNQYGLREQQIKELQDKIIQGSGNDVLGK